MNNSGKLIHVEIMRRIFFNFQSTHKPYNRRSLVSGNPTGNSYLIVGEERALLFDLAVNEPGLREYTQELAGKPVQLDPCSTFHRLQDGETIDLGNRFLDVFNIPGTQKEWSLPRLKKMAWLVHGDLYSAAFFRHGRTDKTYVHSDCHEQD